MARDGGDPAPESSLLGRERQGAIVRWRWSALVALGTSDAELLSLVLVAFALHGFEFARIVAPFVGFALVAAPAVLGFLLPRFVVPQLATVPEPVQ
jgi:hypothetical protein